MVKRELESGAGQSAIATNDKRVPSERRSSLDNRRASIGSGIEDDEEDHNNIPKIQVAVRKRPMSKTVNCAKDGLKCIDRH